ncbi:hypothetical protein EGW08_007512 [Elysia chlorotica]|uniref:G-protein coupled receptors family 1 profile domain-containing protein n=1 Tax=Elysia chlorotica TaxID=188477 RepID=A0A433TT41_ELYCH|nr:hypothetical protein EGW08_007512 [Elysia chlorotica]
MANLSHETTTINNIGIINPGFSGGSNVFGTFDISDHGDNDLLGSLKKYNNREILRLQEAATDIGKYYLIVLFTIGVPCNALTVATIVSMQALTPATFYVALLAVFDGCALIVKLIGNQISLASTASIFYCNVLDPLSSYFTITANWVLVLICLERFVSVCYPLQKAYIFTKRRSYISAAILAGFTFVFIMTHQGVMRTTGKEGCITRPRYSSYYNNEWIYISACLYLFIPFVIIVCFTACIIYGLRKSRKHHVSLMRKNDEEEEMKVLEDGARSSEGHGKTSRSMSTPVTPTAAHNQKMLKDTERVERTITLMLVAAGGIFLLLSLPLAVYYIIRGLNRRDEYSVESARWTLYRYIAFVFFDSSHAVNFFVYFFTAKRFRTQMLRVVTGRASCWGRRISQRGRKPGSSGYQQKLRLTSKSSTSCSTATTGVLASPSGPRKSTVYFPPTSE